MTYAAFLSVALYVVEALGAVAVLGLISKAYLQAKAADEEEARRIARERVNQYYGRK